MTLIIFDEMWKERRKKNFTTDGGDKQSRKSEIRSTAAARSPTLEGGAFKFVPPLCTREPFLRGRTLRPKSGNPTIRARNGLSREGVECGGALCCFVFFTEGPSTAAALLLTLAGLGLRFSLHVHLHRRSFFLPLLRILRMSLISLRSSIFYCPPVNRNFS